MTKITNFVWNTVDDCVISELDGNNNVQAVYTNEPQQYGGVLSQRRNGTTSTYHTDALGTTRTLTDETGTVTDTYVYDAWGNEVASSGTTVNPFRWVGRYGYYQDASTGLVYVRARMYQPAMARWMSLDPLPWLPGINLIGYVTNSPIIATDPSGTRQIDANPEFAPSFSNYDYRSLAHSTDVCHADPDDHCICLNAQEGCEFFIFVNINPPSTILPIFKSIEKTFSFDLTLEAHPGPRKDVTKPIDNSTCFGDFGRSPNFASITVVRDNGNNTQARCVLTKDMFSDPGGAPEEEKMPPECRGLVKIEQLLSRIPPSTLGHNGIRYKFSGSIISAEFDFEIETFCGCGVDPENLGRPGGAIKSAGRIKVKARIP